MNYTKGELHRHDLDIHIQRSESGKVVEHTCIAVGNKTTNLPDEANIEHILNCWNSQPALLEALKALFYSPIDETGRTLLDPSKDKYQRPQIKKALAAIAKATKAR